VRGGHAVIHGMTEFKKKKKKEKKLLVIFGLFLSSHF
jgi:hypothetical protein